MMQFVQQHDLRFAGVPVEFDPLTGILKLAGEEFTVEGWIEFRRRVDLILKRMVSGERWQEIKEAMAWAEQRSRLPAALKTHVQPATLPMLREVSDGKD